MKTIELFPCSGGLTEGFRRAGLSFTASFDIDRDACDSHEQNLGKRPIQLDVRELVRMARLGLIDGTDLAEGRKEGRKEGGPPRASRRRPSMHSLVSSWQAKRTRG